MKIYFNAIFFGCLTKGCAQNSNVVAVTVDFLYPDDSRKIQCIITSYEEADS